MIYSTQLASGQLLEIENSGPMTYLTISSNGNGQQQSQRTAFDTGPWTNKPELYLTASSMIVEVRTASGPQSLVLSGNSVHRMSGPISVEDAQSIPLRESQSVNFTPMEPMAPMKPLAPMKPMAPMGGPAEAGEMRLGDMVMKPGEMRMGNMHLSFNTQETAASSPPKPAEAEPSRATPPKFCTQCGHPTTPADRFCGECGHHLVS